MRVNVYTEELLGPASPNDPPLAEVVSTEYVSSRTGEKMKNWGVRIYIKSAPELHYIPGRDDDRSAITFWCGPKEKNAIDFLDNVREAAYATTLGTWRDKTAAQQDAALAAEQERKAL